ncbi:MAG: hypothetical protein O2854_03080, partial [Chloroflexi bacterium]|nr:hypothetical protein [Chloroflexota bacterium]
MASPAASDKKLVEFVPQNTTVLISVRAGDALTDPDLITLQDILSESGEAGDSFSSLEQGLNEITDSLGLDLRSVNEVLLFFTDLSGASDSVSSLGGSDEDIQGAVIFRASYNREKFVTTIEEEEGPAQISQYNGHELLTTEAGTVISFLSENTIVLGEASGVQAVVDVLEGDAASLSGQMRSTFNDLGSPWIKMVVQPSKADLESVLQEEGTDFGLLGGTPPFLDAFAQLSIVSVTLDNVDSTFVLHAIMDFETAGAATEAGDGMDGLLKT